MIRLLALAVLLTALPSVAQRKITDDLGREVIVPEHAHRIVCLLPSVVDDVYALGAGDDVVGITDFTKYPEVALKKPSVGLPLSPSLEAIIALHPDLVIGSGDLNRLDTAQSLSRYGIPVFMVNPHGLQGIYVSLLSLGRALHRESAAGVLVQRLKARELAVRARAAGRPPVRVFMPVWYDPIVTVGKTSFISELVKAAGARSVTDDIAQEWPQVSLEAMLARKPDALLLVKSAKFSLRDLQKRPGWDAMDAVREGRVFYLDDRVDFSSPVAFDAMEELSKELYP
jgi:ABC-type Fe3+-hydroxamate transport system substrate-binding protein